MYHNNSNYTYNGNYPIVTNPYYIAAPSQIYPTYMTPYYYTYLSPFNQNEENGTIYNNRRALPKRETPKLCQEYLKTGVCSYNKKCRYRHIKKDDEKEGLNSRGYPLRLDKKDCEFYCKKGWCGYGISCKFNHPEITHEIKSERKHDHEWYHNDNNDTDKDSFFDSHESSFWWCHNITKLPSSNDSPLPQSTYPYTNPYYGPGHDSFVNYQFETEEIYNDNYDEFSDHSHLINQNEHDDLSCSCDANSSLPSNINENQKEMDFDCHSSLH